MSPPILPPDLKQTPEDIRLCALRPGTLVGTHNKGVAEDWEESCSAEAWLWKMQRLRHQTEEGP